MKKFLFVLALLCVAAGTLQAQNVYQWFGTDPVRTGPPTTDWSAGYAWMTELGPDPTGTYGTKPDQNAKVKINNVQWGTNWDQYSPVVSNTQSIGDVFVAEGGAALSPEYLSVVTGGTLNVIGAGGTAEGQINLGYQTGAIGGLKVLGGTVNVSGPVHVGWGGTGSVVIANGGVLNVFAIDIGGNLGNGSIDIADGTLVVRGFAGDLLQGYLDNGQLTSNGSADGIVITYDEGLDKTFVTPEPVSIALMGLGALLLRKRS